MTLPCIISLVIIMTGQEDGRYSRDLVSQARTGWKRLMHCYNDMCVRGVCNFKQSLEGLSSTSEFRFLKRGSCRLLFDRRHGTKDVTEEVFGLNPRYSFIIDRSAAGALRVTELVPQRNEQSPSTNVSQEKYTLAQRALGQSMCRLGGDHVEDLLTSPRVVFGPPEWSERLGRRVVKIAFSFPEGDWYETKSGRLVSGGELIMNPDENWIPYQHVIKYARKHGSILAGKVVVTVADSAKYNGIEYPTELECQCNWKFPPDCAIAALRGKENNQVYNWSFTPLSCPDSDADFTLSAFGLPEPYGIEWERPIPWGLYIICGTLGMVVVMGVVWRIRRWRAAT